MRSHYRPIIAAVRAGSPIMPPCWRNPIMRQSGNPSKAVAGVSAETEFRALTCPNVPKERGISGLRWTAVDAARLVFPQVIPEGAGPVKSADRPFFASAASLLARR
jgi:hypothetical protein